MADSALVRFECLTFKAPEAMSVVKATRDSFNIVESLAAQTTSQDRVLRELIDLLLKEAKDLVSAAPNEKKAQAGFSFTKKAADMCNSLLDPTNSNEAIQETIMEVRVIAKQAHEDATSTANRFRETREMFNSILSRIPSARASMERRQQKAQESKDKLESRADRWGNMVETLLPISNKRRKKKKKKKARSKDKGTSTSEEDTTDRVVKELTRDSIHIMGTLLSLPVTFPFIVAAKWRQSWLETQAQGVGSEIIDAEHAIKDLDTINKAYAMLMEKINAISNYWIMMDAVLEDIHSRIDRLRADDASQITAMSLATNLKEVGIECGTYRLQLAEMMDTNPTIRDVAEGKEVPSGTIKTLK